MAQHRTRSRRYDLARALGVLVLLLTFVATGCTATGSRVPGAVSTAEPCCQNPEPYPQWLGRLGLALSPSLGRLIGSIVLRAGHLERHPEAIALLRRNLRPLDIVAVRAKGRFSQVFVPGRFGHVAIYLGTEEQLRRLGAWDDPRIRSFHKSIRRGLVFVEADRKGVHLSHGSQTLAVDAAAVLRPRLGKLRRREAAGALSDAIGTPFDFQFDADDSSCLFCTELAANIMPELGLRKREAYGRRTIFPDDVAYRAATGSGPIDVVAYVEARRADWTQRGRKELLADLRRAWLPKTWLAKTTAAGRHVAQSSP